MKTVTRILNSDNVRCVGVISTDKWRTCTVKRFFRVGCGRGAALRRRAAPHVDAFTPDASRCVALRCRRTARHRSATHDTASGVNDC